MSHNVKSRKIISRQTGRIEISSFKISPEFLKDQNRFLRDLPYTFFTVLDNMNFTAVRHEVNNLKKISCRTRTRIILYVFYGV